MQESRSDFHIRTLASVTKYQQNKPIDFYVEKDVLHPSCPSPYQRRRRINFNWETQETKKIPLFLMASNKSIDFFDRQFREQPPEVKLRLNPFESAVLPHLYGKVLDFGSGMGNLAFAAAARGCAVTALDASPAAIEHIKRRAAAEGSPIAAQVADLRDHRLTDDYDCIVSIGLLMFFDGPTALGILGQLQDRVRPGGIAAINVMIEGSTYLDMFDPSGYCLFEPDELGRRFAGWELLHSTLQCFDAPMAKVKRFTTIVARKPQ